MNRYSFKENTECTDMKDSKGIKKEGIRFIDDIGFNHVGISLK